MQTRGSPGGHASRHDHRLVAGAFCLLIAALLLLIGCASTDKLVKVDEAVSQGYYQQGIQTLEKDRKKIYRSRDSILYYLDRGMLSHFAEEYEESIDLLQDGERAIEAAFTRSVTLEIGTYILNDTTQEYPGEDYEDIYINAFNALNYYHINNLESAMVEVRRMSNKLRFLASKYGVVMSNMQQKALEDSTEIPANDEIGTMQFTDSALARYLSLLFYRTRGQWDDARIDLNALRVAFANAPQVYAFPPPSSIDEEVEIPYGQARLNILGFCGFSPIKQQQDLRIPLPGPRWIKIALPVLVERPSQVGRIEVTVSNGERFNLELLEDMGAVARETFKEREKVIYAKSIIRASAKGIASSAMGVVGDQVGGSTGLILNIASLGTQVAAEATEQADLRIARYFPARAYVGGITLDPGVYSIRVNYYSVSGALIASFVREDIAIRGNALNLQEFICLR